MVLSIDLETVPLESSIATMPVIEIPEIPDVSMYPTPERPHPANYKDPLKINEWERKDRIKWETEQVTARELAIENKAIAIQKYIKDCSLDPYLGRIVAIGVATDVSDAIAATAPTEADEVALLERFWKGVRGAALVVTFNGRQFDLAFIRTRSILLGVKPTLGGREIGEWFRKYTTRPMFDVMDVLADFDNRNRRPLAFYCKALLGKEKGHDSGSVYERYQRGEIDDIGRSAASDAADTLAIYQRISPYFP